MFDLYYDFGNNKKKEAMLYYLYMMSDGEVSYSEKKMFDEICTELEIGSDEKEEAITECLELVTKPEDAFYIIVNERLDFGERLDFSERLDNVSSIISSINRFNMRNWFSMQNDKASLSRIIWNLVNLGYADTVFSENEKEIIKYLLKKWEIGDEVYQEMIDTAETMLALTKQKEWLISKYNKNSERYYKEKKVDCEIQELLSDMKLTIAELEM